MDELTEEQFDLIERFEGKGLDAAWDAASDELKRYKCNNCKIVVWETPCPNCGNTILERMCPIDHIFCNHTPVPGFAICKICGKFICPIDGCHDIEVLSRITGYIQPIDSWNAGKTEEFKNRVRY